MRTQKKSISLSKKLQVNRESLRLLTLAPAQLAQIHAAGGTGPETGPTGSQLLPCSGGAQITCLTDSCKHC